MIKFVLCCCLLAVDVRGGPLTGTGVADTGPAAAATSVVNQFFCGSGTAPVASSNEFAELKETVADLREQLRSKYDDDDNVFVSV